MLKEINNAFKIQFSQICMQTANITKHKWKGETQQHNRISYQQRKLCCFFSLRLLRCIWTLLLHVLARYSFSSTHFVLRFYHFGRYRQSFDFTWSILHLVDSNRVHSFVRRKLVSVESIVSRKYPCYTHFDRYNSHQYYLLLSSFLSTRTT